MFVLYKHQYCLYMYVIYKHHHCLYMYNVMHVIKSTEVQTLGADSRLATTTHANM